MARNNAITKFYAISDKTVNLNVLKNIYFFSIIISKISVTGKK